MSRRHISPSGGEPLPPYSENLVFWAPLTEGDLTDHISGLVPNVQGSATWDANKGMYLLDSTQNNQRKAALRYTKSGGFDINCQTGWTLFGIFEKVSSTWNYNAIMACTSIYLRNVGWSTNKECFIYVNELLTGVLSGIHKICIATTNGVGAVNVYVDGVLVYTGDGYSASQMSNPPTQVDICASNSNSNRICEYAKDVRVYNRKLTASEVAQL